MINNQRIKRLKIFTFWFLFFTFIGIIAEKIGLRPDKAGNGMNWEDILILLPEIMITSFIVSLIFCILLFKRNRIKR
jgi:hypothetical protein